MQTLDLVTVQVPADLLAEYRALVDLRSSLAGSLSSVTGAEFSSRLEQLNAVYDKLHLLQTLIAHAACSST